LFGAFGTKGLGCIVKLIKKNQ